ncbi:MAG TPA: hypothetical protein VMT68_01700 [Caulobacteraceae bacterium]|nr:hypothetical protein [Caulobacteraceae bacterium]
MHTRPTRSRLAAAAFAALFAIAGASAAAAATQGTPGTTSSGSVTINASIAARVAISNLSDVTFADTDLAPVLGSGTSAQKTENVCVWSNNSDRSYFITASGSGAANAFTLASGANPVIPYSVAWNQQTGQSSGTALSAATKSSKFTSTAVSTNCGGGASATLLVSILGTDAGAMLAGASYTGTLTLLVSPT